MIDINNRFNVCSTISYYNVRHIKDTIYEAEANVKLFQVGDFENSASKR